MDKQICIPEESYNFMKDLAQKMKKQDNRSTASPHLYMIREKYKEYNLHGEGEFSEYVCEGESYDKDQVIEYMRENYLEDLTDEECMEKAEEDGYVEYTYNLETRFSETNPNVFLTEDAAKKHLKLNNYHFHGGFDYIIHAWRNPEMEMLFKVIADIGGRE